MSDRWIQATEAELWDARISPRALQLYLRCKLLSGPDGCWATISRIAGPLDRRAAQRALQELVDAGWLRREERPGRTTVLICVGPQGGGGQNTTGGDLTTGGQTTAPVISPPVVKSPQGGWSNDHGGVVKSPPDQIPYKNKRSDDPDSVTEDHKRDRQSNGEGGGQITTPGQSLSMQAQERSGQEHALREPEPAAEPLIGPRTRKQTPPASPLPGRDLRAHPRGIRNPPTWGKGGGR